MYGGFYLEYTSDGKPYLGYEYTDAVANVRLFICTKDTAMAAQLTFGQAIDELMKMNDKLVAAEGSIDGLRKPEGRQQLKPGGSGKQGSR